MTSAPTNGTLARWWSALAVYGDRRILCILFLGFSSGLPLALTGSTLSAWLAQGGVDKTTIGLFALVAIPYAYKFVWSPLIDGLRLPLLTRWLGRRRGWAVASQIGPDGGDRVARSGQSDAAAVDGRGLGRWWSPSCRRRKIS